MAEPKDTPKDEAVEADETSEPQTSEEPKRRRGSAETGAAKKREAAPEAPRDDSGAVAVRAQAKYVRSAPRKARLVMDHIRGKDVADARAILRHTSRAVASDISKLLESAVANAENNFELDPEELRIGRAVVDEGPTIKRYRPRAQGRATRINKRTSHMTITLTGKDSAGMPNASHSNQGKEA
jgi:ribosomal protein L22